MSLSDLITREPAVVEHIHYDNDGHVRPMKIHAYPLLDGHGEVIQRIEYGLNIVSLTDIVKIAIRKSLINP